MTKLFASCVLAVVFALSGAAASWAGEFSTAEVHTMPGGDKVAGTAWLIRSDDGIRAAFETSGLEPGHTHTLWWVIFNNPSACSDTCGRDDFPNNPDADPSVMASSVWGDGALVGEDGMAHFRSRVGNANAPGFIDFGPGLLDPYKAEVHLVVRSHGPVKMDEVGPQLTTARGGCAPKTPEMDECPNVQGAAFLVDPGT